MMKKLLILVPYRDRERHLSKFVPHIKSLLNEQSIDYGLVIVEQSSNNLFNRGLLCNVGFDLFYESFDYICIHDVDMMGEDFDYRYEPFVTHLSAKERKRKYVEWYDRYLGGVTLFPCEDFIKINGFNNSYWGWGCEDDDLRLRCDIMEVDVRRKLCKYFTLFHESLVNEEMSHEERKIVSPGFAKNLEMLKSFQNTKDINLITNNGLSTVKNHYSILSFQSTQDYNLVKVNLF